MTIQVKNECFSTTAAAIFNPEEKQIFFVQSAFFTVLLCWNDVVVLQLSVLFLKHRNKHVATKYLVCAEALCFKSHLKAIRDFKAKYSTRRTVILYF